uniref:Uncharacterized protein n=1 Tax=Anopheles maculatus TaxID=74869 RepID=A0A182T3A0_9DIPT
MYRRTVAVPSYVRTFEGLPPLDEQENLNHWYCDRCLAVYQSLRSEGNVRKEALVSSKGKTEKLIELVRNCGDTERVKQSDMLNQQLLNRSESKNGGRSSSSLKECLVNVFQRLTIESSATQKTEYARRQSFNAIKYKKEPTHGIDAVGRTFLPSKTFGVKGKLCFLVKSPRCQNADLMPIYNV